MCLNELLVKCCGSLQNIRCPNCFLNVEVENAENFCFYALKNYFLSDKFCEDLENCKEIYDFAESEGLFQILYLERDGSGIFTIKLDAIFIGD